jgi:hypothetical protein
MLRSIPGTSASTMGRQVVVFYHMADRQQKKLRPKQNDVWAMVNDLPEK